MSNLGKRQHWVAFTYRVLFLLTLSKRALLVLPQIFLGVQSIIPVGTGILQHDLALSLLHAVRGRLAMRCWVPVRGARPYPTWQFSPRSEFHSRHHDAIHDLGFPPLPGC